MRRFVALVALVGSTSVLAQDNRWIKIGGSSTDQLMIDPGSIKVVSGSIRSAWFQFRKTPVPKFGQAQSTQLERINCDEETTATVTYVTYDARGGVLNSNSTPISLLNYTASPPDTLAATMVRVVCNFDVK